MRDAAFAVVALALAAGLAAQALAARLAIPSIVILLATGVVLGPGVFGVLDPPCSAPRAAIS
jgi:NhaP-type Na+/H+ or K+/H+ antiporter